MLSRTYLRAAVVAKCDHRITPAEEFARVYYHHPPTPGCTGPVTAPRDLPSPRTDTAAKKASQLPLKCTRMWVSHVTENRIRANAKRWAGIFPMLRFGRIHRTTGGTLPGNRHPYRDKPPSGNLLDN